MELNYLDFDYSEDAEGGGTFDAMASVAPAQVAALHADIARVLDWAGTTFPGARASLDEGGEWDYDLQAQQEWTAQEDLTYDEQTRQFSSQLHPAGPPRHTVSLSLSGTAQFCEAFRQRFGVD